MVGCGLFFIFFRDFPGFSGIFRDFPLAGPFSQSTVHGPQSADHRPQTTDHSDRLSELLPGLFFALRPRRGRGGRTAYATFMAKVYSIDTHKSTGYFIFFAGGGGDIEGGGSAKG